MDFIILIILSIVLYHRAKKFGEKPWLWISRLSLIFLSTYVVILLISSTVFGKDKEILIATLGLGFASLSAVYIFHQFEKIVKQKLDSKHEEESLKDQKPNLDHFR